MLKLFSKEQGFTLTELIIATAIIAIISVISFSGLNQSSEYFALQDATRQTSDLYRTAQSYATNIRVNPNDGNFGGSFAVYALYYQDPTENPSKVIFYADENTNRSYDSGSGECTGECINVLQYGRGINIVEIKATDVNNQTYSLTEVEMFFDRPDLDPYIKGVGQDEIKEVEIVLENRSGDRESVIIGATGYIFTNN